MSFSKDGSRVLWLTQLLCAQYLREFESLSLRDEAYLEFLISSCEVRFRCY